MNKRKFKIIIGAFVVILLVGFIVGITGIIDFSREDKNKFWGMMNGDKFVGTLLVFAESGTDPVGNMISPTSELLYAEVKKSSSNGKDLIENVHFSVDNSFVYLSEDAINDDRTAFVDGSFSKQFNELEKNVYLTETNPRFELNVELVLPEDIANMSFRTYKIYKNHNNDFYVPIEKMPGTRINSGVFEDETDAKEYSIGGCLVNEQNYNINVKLKAIRK